MDVALLLFAMVDAFDFLSINHKGLSWVAVHFIHIRR
jgi:hypothetical protein